MYMLQGNNLNIAQNENVTTYGNVNGMTYLGMYTSSANPIGTTTRTGNNNVYVMGKHKANHNITTDGFYTNETNSIHKYVIPTPTSADYYIWLIGRIPDESQLDTELTAYKYSTIDTVELPLISNSEPNTIFNVSNLEADLMPTVSIKNKLQIPATATTEDIANTTFGLEMQTGTSGWVSSKTTDYYVNIYLTIQHKFQV